MPAPIEFSDGSLGLVDEDVLDAAKELGPWHVANRKKTPSVVAYVKGSTAAGAAPKYQQLSHLVIGKPPRGHVVDHIDGDPRNNTRANLRVATYQQNAANKRSRKQWKGVTRSSKGFYATINTQGIYVRSISYPSAEMAAAAYNQLALHLFGEFASLNIVSPSAAAICALDDIRAMHQQRISVCRRIIEMLERP